MEENKQESIADLIKKYRKEKKVTQELLCEAAGISISTLKKYETGLRNPKPEQLRKIAQALGVSEQVFMPITVKDRSDILMTIMQLDKETDLTIDYKNNSEGVIIPETITISFKDHELNRMIAEYVHVRDHAETNEDLRFGKQVLAYKTKIQEKKSKKEKKNED